MAVERILIAVKTYPTLSKTYTELVCTAGFREDGSWIRIYPSPFRFLEEGKKYAKFQWVDVDIDKNPRDSRPESYRPINIDGIQLRHSMGTEGGWSERRKFILGNNQVHTNLSDIIAGAHNNEFSLVVFKPREILDFVAKKVDEDWAISRRMAAEESAKQGSLFDEGDKPDFKLMPKLPYKFSYRFKDDEGKESTLMIEDWEIGQLYWNCRKKYDESLAVQKVREKYLNDFARSKDLHLFLGTTYEHHMRKARNPYVIIGAFPLPIENQLSLLYGIRYH